MIIVLGFVSFFFLQVELGFCNLYSLSRVFCSGSVERCKYHQVVDLLTLVLTMNDQAHPIQYLKTLMVTMNKQAHPMQDLKTLMATMMKQSPLKTPSKEGLR